MVMLFALGSLIGATIPNFLQSLPSLGIVLGFTILSLVMLPVVSLFANKQISKSCGLTLIGIIVGFSWTYVTASRLLSWELPLGDVGRSIEIVGTVEGMTRENGAYQQFDVRLARYEGETLSKPIKIRLTWRHLSNLCLDGDTIRASVKLKPIWDLSNPGGIDWEKKAFREGIRARGYIVSMHAHTSVEQRSLTRIRIRLSEKIANLLEGKPLLGVIQAMTLGVYHNITPEQSAIFQASGTAHVIAISGLHVALIAGVCGAIVTFITRRFYVLTQYCPAQCYGALGAMLGALGYSAIAGFSLPTQRALIMIVVALIAMLMRQSVLTWHRLGVAWLVIALFDPLATLQMGFWLSFGSVAALIYSARIDGRGFFIRWMWPQVVAFIGLLPLCALFFRQLTPYSPLANLITLPIVSFIVVPVSLLGVLLSQISAPLASLCLHLSHSVLALLWVVLEKITQLPYSVITLNAVPWVYLFLAFCASVLVLAPRSLPLKPIGCLGFLPLLFFQANDLKKGEYRFTLLDVGQGLSAVVQTQHHALLFDAGPQQRVIKPFMSHQGIRGFDKVIISHGDLDHRGGLSGLKGVPLGQVHTSEPNKIPIPSSMCHAGQTWEWDGVTFTMLNPISTHHKKRNDLSCVLKVEGPRYSVLLTGDIEKRAETQLLKHHAKQLPSTILVVPHHGSLTSSSNEFVKTVSPQYALYPVGLANRYHFPKSKVLERYESLGANNLLVSHTGALLFTVGDGTLPEPVKWRDSTRRYWHTRLAQVGKG